MNTITPIKRSEFLAPLSREHHETLLLNWKIKQGIKLNVDRIRITEYCKWFLDAHMRNHFRKEEEELTKILPAENSMMTQMFNEHKAIAEKISLMNADSSDAEMLSLGELINTHVRFEERQLFQLIEEVATLDARRILEASLAAKTTSEKWADEFWIPLQKEG